jgi:hypothetical protein
MVFKTSNLYISIYLSVFENYVRREGNKNILTCVCGEMVCFKCGNSAHKGISCPKALDKTFFGAIKNFKVDIFFLS